MNGPATRPNIAMLVNSVYLGFILNFKGLRPTRKSFCESFRQGQAHPQKTIGQVVYSSPA
jgi:hypothetical protein